MSLDSPHQERRLRRGHKKSGEDWRKHLEAASTISLTESYLNPKILRHHFPDLSHSGTKNLLEEMTRQGVLGPPKVGKGRACLKPPTKPSSNLPTASNGHAGSIAAKNSPAGDLGQILPPLSNVPPERAHEIMKLSLRCLKADVDQVLAVLEAAPHQ